MAQKSLTETEQAQEYLLTKDSSEFEQSLLVSIDKKTAGIVLYYFQAKGQLGRKFHAKNHSISDQDKERFQKNNTRLENLKKEIATRDLISLVKRYNESIILGGLIQLIRDNEANILTYDFYLKLKEKFFNWPKVGIRDDRILLSWKDFSKAIHEVDEWIIEKKEAYIPIMEKLIKFIEDNPNYTAETLYLQLLDLPEKEVFYFICNMLLTNPPLRIDFLSIAQLKDEKLLTFEKTIFQILDIIDKKTSETNLKGLILLFKQQIADVRSELVESN